MLNDKYVIRYLPMFYDDLLRIVTYIKDDLQNPGAAERLVDDIESAVIQRSTCAESFEQYHSSRDRMNPYYVIHVRNYDIYYVVLDNSVMEVRRCLFKRQNRSEIV